MNVEEEIVFDVIEDLALKGFVIHTNVERETPEKNIIRFTVPTLGTGAEAMIVFEFNECNVSFVGTLDGKFCPTTDFKTHNLADPRSVEKVIDLALCWKNEVYKHIIKRDSGEL